MKLHFVSVPVMDSEAAAADLNQFLASHRIASVDRQLVSDGPRSAWAVCVTYVEGPAATKVTGKKGKIDYREVLPEEEFRVYARLRDLRNGLAEREGVPAYALFSNEHLADMVRRRVRTSAELMALDGVGEARTAKYGPAFLEVLAQVDAPKQGAS